ncbi:MAG: polyprenyl synthetase family protein [Acidimicrobiales bacterium]
MPPAAPAGLSAPSVVTDGVARVEDALRAALDTGDAFLTDVASHLIAAGGKRLRPAFAVAAGATGGVDRVTDDVVQGGASVELVHVGSLYHDDVIDDATTRHDVDSVNARWGNLVAILAGDFLLARASEIAASLGTEVAGLLAATIGRLCQGEVIEIRTAFDTARTEESYVAAIAGKTAALFSSSARIGAIVGGLPRPHIDALTAFGERYGMAFQIVDDVFDVIATDGELGKPAGHDMVEGVYTLPVLRTLANGSRTAEELRAVLGKPLDEAEKDHARDLVRRGGAVSDAIAVADGYARSAIAALGMIGESEATAWLAGAARQLVDRVASRV